MIIDSPRTLTKRDPEANDKTTMGIPGFLPIPMWDHGVVLAAINLSLQLPMVSAHTRSVIPAT